MTWYAINQKFRAAPQRRPDDVPGPRVVKVAEMFGVGLDEAYEVVLYDDFRLDIRPGDVAFITGPSGSGKSVLAARLEEAVRRADPASRVVNLADVLLPADAASATAGRPVIELMTGPLQESLRLLSAAGLADAFLLLRTPQELSDGQRYRLRLALAMEGLLAGAPEGGQRVLVADEFCTTLDRLCARAVAYRVRRLADAHDLTVIAASANDDLLEDLAPDVVIVKLEGPRVEVFYADPEREKVATAPRVRP